jgi:hypothetical protein
MVHEFNSEIVKSGMVVLIEKEKTDTDGWERENWHDVNESKIQPVD